MCLQMPDAQPTVRATRANMLSGAAALPPAAYSPALGKKGQPFNIKTDIMHKFHKDIVARRAQASVCAMEQEQTASLNPQAGIGLAPGNEAVIVGMAASLAQGQVLFVVPPAPDSDSDVDSSSILPVAGNARWARSRTAAAKKKAGSKPAAAAAKKKPTAAAAKKKAAAAAKRKATAAAKKVADQAAKVRGREARSRAEKQLSSAMMAEIAEQRASLAEPGEKQASDPFDDSEYDSADSEDEYGELEDGVMVHAYKGGTARPDMAQKLAEVKVELGAQLTSDSVESYFAEHRAVQQKPAVLCVFRNCRESAVRGPHCAAHMMKKKRSVDTGPTAPRLALALPALP